MHFLKDQKSVLDDDVSGNTFLKLMQTLGVSRPESSNK